MNKAIEEYSMETTRFLAKSEEKIIARFMEIAGLKKEYDEAMNSNKPIMYIDCDWTYLLRELHKRGYEIGEYRESLAPMDGVDKSMKWRMVLLHDGKEVAYSNIEIKIDTMRQTEYGVGTK